MGGFLQRVADFGGQRAVEQQRRDAGLPQRFEFFRRARRAEDRRRLLVGAGKGLAGIAGAEDEDLLFAHACASGWQRQTAIRRARPRRFRFSSRSRPAREYSASGTSRASAQIAAPRTSGEASPSKARTAPASETSPELPAAISTLRTKRSRPMRLIGEPEKKARNAASSSCKQLGQRRLAQIVARGELGLRGRRGRTCSTGRRRGNRRSHRCGCRSFRGIHAGSAPCSRW